jgi:hypothetical protein
MVLRALVDTKVAFSFQEILWACLIAAASGLIFSLVSNHKWFSRVARCIGVTKKSGELDVWGFYFNLQEISWVAVRDHKNDLIYEGWVLGFSDNSKEAELLLRDVSVYRNLTGERLYQVGAVYLSLRRDEISIECRTLPVSDSVKWKEDGDHGEQVGKPTAKS